MADSAQTEFAVDNPRAALSALLSGWQPLERLLDRLELVRFRPVAVLESYKLPLGERH